MTSAPPPPLSVPFSPIDPGRPATIPAVLGEGEPDVLLTAEGIDEMARLTETFVARVADGSGDPRDPQYQRRWSEAQEESDAHLRASLGGHAWLKHHQDAHRSALEDQAQNGVRPGSGASDN
jgi:hypothetical protein